MEKGYKFEDANRGKYKQNRFQFYNDPDRYQRVLDARDYPGTTAEKLDYLFEAVPIADKETELMTKDLYDWEVAAVMNLTRETITRLRNGKGIFRKPSLRKNTNRKHNA